MPVHGMVEYDCNISLRTQPITSTTMIVSLPDGMEKHPEALQNALLTGALKRLKVVVTEQVGARAPNWYDSSHRYSVDVHTDRGFRLGTLIMNVPVSTGWNGHVLNLAENYFPTEVEGYVGKALKDQIVIRVNQRTPPLPRVGLDPAGKREDMVWKVPIGHPVRPEQDRRDLDRLVYDSLMRSGGTRYWMEQAEVRHRSEEQRIKNELKLRLADMAADTASVAEEMLTESRLPKEPGQDVGRRTQVDRTDVARRGGSYSYDVASEGTVLDL